MISESSISNIKLHKKNGSSLRKRETFAAWSFCALPLFFLFLFLVTPFIIAFVVSFTDQRLIPNPNLPTQFIALRNFLRLFSNPNFHQALLNTFIFAVIVVPLQTFLALLLAVLVNQKLRFINLFRTIYFSPVVTTMVVVSIIWYFLYNPGEGLINQMISFISFGKLGPYNWLNDTALALPAIMILSVWQGVGFQMVIYLAGLQGIPDELYEAGRVDGANAWQQFWQITIPQLRNTTIFVIISTTILAFKLFTQVWVMTKGGPQGATKTIIVLLYEEGFKMLRVGYASAIGVLFFLIVLAVSLIQRVYLKEERAVI
ncbi:ABC transporter permease [Candidatus Atribacteria bacterium 4572_76]|nr:MAG: ABC transporter permease [Candidatus Atribacteria bacterium 4572_76]RLC38336.1 MAG: sugar ABC transporter permease [Candidatus Nealsonbacteria bacterium]